MNFEVFLTNQPIERGLHIYNSRIPVPLLDIVLAMFEQIWYIGDKRRGKGIFCMASTNLSIRKCKESHPASTGVLNGSALVKGSAHVRHTWNTSPLARLHSPSSHQLQGLWWGCVHSACTSEIAAFVTLAALQMHKRISSRRCQMLKQCSMKNT